MLSSNVGNHKAAVKLVYEASLITTDSVCRQQILLHTRIGSHLLRCFKIPQAGCRRLKHSMAHYLRATKFIKALECPSDDYPMRPQVVQASLHLPAPDSSVVAPRAR
eukprot:362572-Chlamydomonas_euryale.AAC.1